MKTNITLDVDTVRRVLARSKPEGFEGIDQGDQRDRRDITHALLQADFAAAWQALSDFYAEHDDLAPEKCPGCGSRDGFLP